MKKTAALSENGVNEPRLYRVVSSKIEELIRAENIRPGERLPAERELATKLGVSRTSLRTALRLIADAPRDHLILVAAHHPLLDLGLTEAARTKGGADALQQLAAAGADAVLTGHVHYPFDTPVERAGRTVRLIGAGTLSKRLRHSPPA